MEKNLNKILNEINIKADWIGIREVREITTYRSVRDGNPKANDRHLTHGILIEVLYNGQFGYYGTNKFDSKSIQNAASSALEQAKLASKWSLCSFDKDVRPKSVGKFSSYRENNNEISSEILNDILMKTNESIKVSDKIVSASSFFKIVETDINFVSSSGSEFSQDFLLMSIDFSATAQDGNIIQSRSANGRLAQSYQAGYEVFDEHALLNKAQIVGEQAVELLSAEECPTKKTNLVLAPDQMMLQIHESIGHPLEMDRILGDERNYAGWSFVRLEDFGNLKYGSDLLNVTLI